MSALPDSLFDQLLQRLNGHESLEVEFKRGRGGLPDDLWSTVSAFANTYGGWVVIGVREDENGDPVFEGLANPEQRLQDFVNLARNRQKISADVCGAGDARIERVDGAAVLVIRVRAAPRRERPVFVGRNPYEGTYVRRHSGDFRCDKPEVDRMIREASDTSLDSLILTGFTIDDLDVDAVARYRRRYQTRQPGSPWNGYDDQRFLRALGAYRYDRQTSQEGITIAGLLLFGTTEALREWRGRHLIDYRRLPDADSVHERWLDRVAWDGHIFGAFETIYPRLVSSLPTPFQIASGVRHDESPTHEAMREALVNLLVHADYTEKAVSLVAQDVQGCYFRNPGDSRVSLLDVETGDRSDPRNPVLVAAFRQIGLADEAGTGIPKILDAWNELGLRRPRFDVDTERYEFVLDLRFAHFLSDDDRIWLAALGEGDDPDRHLALVHARTEGWVDNAALCNLTGLHPADATRVLASLRTDGLLNPTGERRWRSYSLSDNASALFASRLDDSHSRGQADLFDALALEDQRTARSGREGLSNSSESLGNSGASLGNSGASLDNSTPSVPKPVTFPGTDDEWGDLTALATSLRRHPRAPREDIERGMIALCGRAALSVSEIALLVGKTAGRVRQVVRAMRAANELEYLYPDRLSSPNQRYIAGPSAA